MQRIFDNKSKLSVVRGGDGPIVLFVHGFPFDHSLFHPVATLLDYGFGSLQYLIPDLPGFGESPSFSNYSDKPATMEEFADRLAILLDSLEISDQIVLCGLSMGGYIALEFARKYEKRLIGLVLSNTRSTCDTPEVKQNRLDLAETVLTQGTAEMVNAMLPNLVSDETRTEREQRFEVAKSIMLSQDAESVSTALRAMAARVDTTLVLRSLSIPVLCIGGEDDKLSPPETMEQMSREAVKGKYVEIPRCGHLPPLESPERYLKALEDFIDPLNMHHGEPPVIYINRFPDSEDDPESQPDAMFDLAELREIQQRRTRFETEIPELEEELAKGNQEIRLKLSQRTFMYGITLDTLGEADLAFKAYTRAISVITEDESLSGTTKARLLLADLYLQVGILFCDGGQWDRSLEYYDLSQKEVEILLQEGEESAQIDLPGILLNKSTIYWFKDERETSDALLDEAIGMLRTTVQKRLKSTENREKVRLMLAQSLISKVGHIAENDEPDENKTAPILELTLESISILRLLRNEGNTECLSELGSNLLFVYKSYKLGNHREKAIDILHEAIVVLTEAAKYEGGQVAEDLAMAKRELEDFLESGEEPT